MKILKLKSIFFSLMAIVMVTVLFTSCERGIIIEEDVEGVKEIIEEDIDGVKEINFDEDIFKILEEVGEYTDPETGAIFFIEENVPDFNELENDLEQKQNANLIEDRSVMMHPCYPNKVLSWSSAVGKDVLHWNSTPSYSLFIRYYGKNDNYLTTSQHNTSYNCVIHTFDFIRNNLECKKFAFVGYRRWGTDTVDDC